MIALNHPDHSFGVIKACSITYREKPKPCANQSGLRLFLLGSSLPADALSGKYQILCPQSGLWAIGRARMR
jgi:hypothetical protein